MQCIGELSIIMNNIIIKNQIPTRETVNFNTIYHFDSIDYFNNSIDNRDSTASRIELYAKKMLNGEWMFELSPIFVGITRMEIMNGQTRVNAIKKALEMGATIDDISVIFVDDSDPYKRDKQVDALNFAKSWDINDYISKWIKKGKKSFITLHNLCMDEDHPKLHKVNEACYAKAAYLLGQSYNGFKNTYQEGDWEISQEDLDRFEERYYQVVRIIKALEFDTSKDYWKEIAQAWYKVSNNQSAMEAISKLNNGFETFYKRLNQHYKLKGTETLKVWVKRFYACIYDEYDCVD